MQFFMFFIGIVNIVGCILNVKKNPFCFILWGITNFILIFHNYNIGEYGQAAMWIMYLCVSVWGFNKWMKDKN